MKTILITGATDGIGRQTALDLAFMGHRVLLHGRNKVRGVLVTNEIKQQTGNTEIYYFNADLSDFAEVNRLADEIRGFTATLDVLMNNAGVFMQDYELLPNGFERTFMVNHLASFLLTMRLTDLITHSSEGRIINVSSQAQAGSIDFDNLNGEKYFDGYQAYGLSKLCNVLFTYKLARYLEQYQHIGVHALHPGVISTKLLHQGWGGGGAAVEKGSKTTVYAAESADLIGKTGLYFVNAEPAKSSAISYDHRIQERLWQISLQACNL